MSTDKMNITGKRFALLARMNETVFHAADLYNLWEFQNKNNLYTTLKRYVKSGLLYRVYNGLYSIHPISELDPNLLAVKALHTYSYMSTETVLADQGIIQQKLNYITLVSTVSKRFTVHGYHYYARRLHDRYLYNNEGIIDINGIKTASIERAVADLLYYNPKACFDGEALIPWDKVNIIQEKLGYKLKENSI
jgi:predicted transcriptional regulator of viral defense system